MRTPSFRAGPAALAVVLLATSLAAQDRGAQPVPKVAPSGRVTTSVTFDGRVLRDGGWFTYTPSHSGPSRITIDYGQPHARDRKIFGGLVPYGEVWRLGANWATRLTLDFDVCFGALDVPRGEYTLFMLPREHDGELIVSRQTRQMGHGLRPFFRLRQDAPRSAATGGDGSQPGGHAGAGPAGGGGGRAVRDAPPRLGRSGVLHRVADALALRTVDNAANRCHDPFLSRWPFALRCRMDATAWTVAGAAIAVLIAIATAFRSLRSEIRLFREHVDNRIDAQGQELRERIDAQGQELREQSSQLRERMAKLKGLLEGLREAITGKRAA